VPLLQVLSGTRLRHWLGLLSCAGGLLSGCAEPSQPAPGEAKAVFSADSSTVRVAAGAHYARRGWLWQRLWGRHYRPLWATPVSAPVLRLGAAGLLPVRAGGSFARSTAAFLCCARLIKT
jgi:hypothetical protein